MRRRRDRGFSRRRRLGEDDRLRKQGAAQILRDLLPGAQLVAYN